MLRIFADSAVSVLIFCIAFIPILKIVLNISYIPKMAYLKGYLAGLVINIFFKYLLGYESKLNFFSYVGVLTVTCLFVSAVIWVIYFIITKIRNREKH